ncbi:MAG TPA: hypothetical protein V6D10_23560 [Trichocoleus sp.]|jgi:hypothetical protein
MNWYAQLTQLILSFYREDPAQFQQLQALRLCRLSRRWGTLRIHCSSQEAAGVLIDAIDLLREPILQLRLAQQIRITVNGKGSTTFPVNPSQRIDIAWLEQL